MKDAVQLERPWLVFDLTAPKRVLSWTLNRPGFVIASRILWREVRNADLPVELDVKHWFEAELAQRGEARTPAFLTSRDIGRYCLSDHATGGATARAVATVGLSNAERVGFRRAPMQFTTGTVNIAVELDTALSDAGLLEAMSIAVQARTAAIIDADIPLPTGPATGTGTDCVAVAAPPGDADFAGLHTEVGEAVGRAVYDAVFAGAVDWKAEQAGLR